MFHAVSRAFDELTFAEQKNACKQTPGCSIFGCPFFYWSLQLVSTVWATGESYVDYRSAGALRTQSQPAFHGVGSFQVLRVHHQLQMIRFCVFVSACCFRLLTSDFTYLC